MAMSLALSGRGGGLKETEWRSEISDIKTS
jgi:hypothetical protein